MATAKLLEGCNMIIYLNNQPLFMVGYFCRLKSLEYDLKKACVLIKQVDPE